MNYIYLYLTQNDTMVMINDTYYGQKYIFHHYSLYKIQMLITIKCIYYNTFTVHRAVSSANIPLHNMQIKYSH